MNEQDEVRLRHMLDAARAAISFAKGRTRADLDADLQLSFALTRAISIIGEAASRVSKECQEANPQIPWPAMTGMRNLLIHAYFDVNLDIVWDTVHHSLPALIPDLEQLLPPVDESG